MATRNPSATSASACAYARSDQGPAPSPYKRTELRLCQHKSTSQAKRYGACPVSLLRTFSIFLFNNRKCQREGKGCRSLPVKPYLCHRGLSKSVKSRTCRSSEASPAGPIPPCTSTILCLKTPLPTNQMPGLTDSASGSARNAVRLLLHRQFPAKGERFHRASYVQDEGRVTWITTMLPTAAAAWAALGEGGSPCGFMRSHLPLRTSIMCTSLVAPASLMPACSRKAPM